MNRPIIPGRVGVDVSMQDGPNAHPISAVMQSPSGMQMMSVGGLTKLEHAAIVLAGHLYHRTSDFAELASLSSDLAEAVLAECGKRRQAKAQVDGNKS